MEIGPVKRRYITPDEAFEVIRECHELAFEEGFADDEFDFTLRSTLKDWGHFEVGAWGVRGDLAWRTWVSHANVLNEAYGIEVPLTEWKPVLTPLNKRTLGDVCTFLSTKAQVPVVPSPTLLGRPCRTAGAFLTVRSMLWEAGADTQDLRPSTPLDRYASAGFPGVHGDLFRVVPKLLPALHVAHRGDFLHLPAGVAFLIGAPLSALFYKVTPALGFILPPLMFALLIWVWRASVKNVAKPPHRVKFEGLTTFRDLSYAIAGTEPSQRARNTGGR